MSAADDLRVVGEAGDGAAAIAGVAACRPDVALTDARTPGLNGTDATERNHRAARPAAVSLYQGLVAHGMSPGGASSLR